MAGNDDIMAQLKAIHTAAEIERLRTALAERDATIERLKADHEHEVEDLCNTANVNLEEMLKQRTRATAAERERDEARAEVERLKKAVSAVTDATADYLPPDGISASECISRILGATDNPEINAIMLEKNDGRPQD